MNLTAVCRVYGLTPRAVRFYEQRGLVAVPRDRLNHRWYDVAAQHRLERIVALRGAGLSLPAIAEILDAEDRSQNGAQVAHAHLKARMSELQRQLERTRSLLSTLAPDNARAGAFQAEDPAVRRSWTRAGA